MEDDYDEDYMAGLMEEAHDEGGDDIGIPNMEPPDSAKRTGGRPPAEIPMGQPPPPPEVQRDGRGNGNSDVHMHIASEDVPADDDDDEEDEDGPPGCGSLSVEETVEDLPPLGRESVEVHGITDTTNFWFISLASEAEQAALRATGNEDDEELLGGPLGVGGDGQGAGNEADPQGASAGPGGQAEERAKKKKKKRLLRVPIEQIIRECEGEAVAKALQMSSQQQQQQQPEQRAAPGGPGTETRNREREAGDAQPQRSPAQTQTELWVDKYSPKGFSELLSEERTNREVLKWVKRWDWKVFKRKPWMLGRKRGRGQNDETDGEEEDVPKVLLLAGPPGVGKTTLANVVARQAGYAPSEVNASDDRTLSALRSRIDAVSGGLMSIAKGGRPQLLILDEIDGAAGGEGGGEGSGRGLISYLVSLMEKSDNDGGTRLKRPVICVCNEAYGRVLRPLREKARVVHLAGPTAQQLSHRLQTICKREGVKAESAAIDLLCRTLGSDVRAAINTLQFLSRRSERHRGSRSVCVKDVAALWMTSSSDMNGGAPGSGGQVPMLSVNHGKDRALTEMEVLGEAVRGERRHEQRSWADRVTAMRGEGGRGRGRGRGGTAESTRRLVEEISAASGALNFSKFSDALTENFLTLPIADPMMTHTAEVADLLAVGDTFCGTSEAGRFNSALTSLAVLLPALRTQQLCTEQRHGAAMALQGGVQLVPALAESKARRLKEKRKAALLQVIDAADPSAQRLCRRREFGHEVLPLVLWAVVPSRERVHRLWFRNPNTGLVPEEKDKEKSGNSKNTTKGAAGLTHLGTVLSHLRNRMHDSNNNEMGDAGPAPVPHGPLGDLLHIVTVMADFGLTYRPDEAKEREVERERDAFEALRRKERLRRRRNADGGGDGDGEMEKGAESDTEEGSAVPAFFSSSLPTVYSLFPPAHLLCTFEESLVVARQRDKSSVARFIADKFRVTGVASQALAMRVRGAAAESNEEGGGVCSLPSLSDMEDRTCRLIASEVGNERLLRDLERDPKGALQRNKRRNPFNQPDPSAAGAGGHREAQQSNGEQKRTGPAAGGQQQAAGAAAASASSSSSSSSSSSCAANSSDAPAPPGRKKARKGLFAFWGHLPVPKREGVIRPGQGVQGGTVAQNNNSTPGVPPVQSASTAVSGEGSKGTEAQSPPPSVAETKEGSKDKSGGEKKTLLEGAATEKEEERGKGTEDENAGPMNV